MAAFALPTGIFDLPKVPIVVVGKVSSSVAKLQSTTYTLRDPSEKLLASGTIKVSKDGTFLSLIMVDPDAKKTEGRR